MKDLQAQFNFITEIRDKISEAHTAIKNIRSIKDQLAPYKKQFKEKEDLTNEIKDVEERLTKIEESLYQTKNQSRQDPLNFPIRVTNKLAHLTSLYQSSNFVPPKQAFDVKAELSAEVDDLLKQYKAILDADIPRLNGLIKAQSPEPISIKEP